MQTWTEKNWTQPRRNNSIQQGKEEQQGRIVVVRPRTQSKSFGVASGGQSSICPIGQARKTIDGVHRQSHSTGGLCAPPIEGGMIGQVQHTVLGRKGELPLNMVITEN